MASMTSPRSRFFALFHVAPAEGEELPGEIRGALGGFHDVLQALAVRGAEPVRRRQHARIEQQRAIHLDHRQHVIEIMRDAAGQPAHRLHLLRLPELLLHPPMRGDVIRHAGDAIHLAGAIADQERRGHGSSAASHPGG